MVKKKRGKNGGGASQPAEPPPVEPPPVVVPDEPVTMAPVMIDGVEPRCDYCLQTSATNRKGEHEELLICKDCQAKGDLSTGYGPVRLLLEGILTHLT